MKWLKISVLFVVILVSNKSNANEILGGHLSYECLGGDQYEITLDLYLDCLAATPATDLFIIFEPNAGCTSNIQSSIMTFQSEVEISTLCPDEFPNSSCNGGILPGTIHRTFTSTITLDPSCEWNIYWAQNDYFENFINTDDFDNQDDAYFFTTINPSLGCSNSVQIDASLQTPYGFVGESISHQLLAVSPSGNTLTYTLVAPQVENNQVISDYPNFDLIDMTITPGGLIEFDLTEEGKYVVSILIEEFDGMGNLISTTIETMSFISREPITGEPIITNDGAISNIGSGGTFVDANNFEICQGDSLCLQFETTHPSTTLLNYTSNITDFEPNATIVDIPCSVTPSDGSSIGCAEVCFLVTAVADFSFDVSVTDSNCDDPQTDETTINVTIGDGASFSMTSSNETICSGTPVAIEADVTGLPDYTLEYSINNSTTTEPDTLSISPFDPLTGVPLSPTETTEYCMVSFVDAEGCIADIDPINTCFTVTVNPQITAEDFGNDTTICAGQSVETNLDLTGTAPFTITYNSLNVETGALTSDETAVLAAGENWILTPDSSTVYTITTITDSAPTTPCTLNVTSEIEITVLEYSEVTLSADELICENAALELNFDFLNFVGPEFDIVYTITEEGGFPIQNTISDIPVAELTPDSNYVSVPLISINNNYTITLDQFIDDENICTAITNTAPIEIDMNPLPTADLSGSADVCFGDTLDLAIDITGNSPWSIVIDVPNSTDNDTIVTAISPAIFEAAFPGTYSLVKVTDSLECIGTVDGTAVYTELDLPTAFLTGDSTLCLAQDVEVGIEFTGLPLFDVEIEDPNGDIINVQSGNVIGDSTFIANIPGDYTIMSVQDNQCTNDTLTGVYTLNTVDVPTLSLTGNNFICAQDSTQLYMNITGGNDPFSYVVEEINSGAVFPFTDVDALDSLYVLTSGEYTVTSFLDSNSCMGSIDQNIIINDRALPALNAGTDFSECANTEVTIGTPEDPALQYQWTSNTPAVLDTLYTAEPQITVINTGAADIIFEAYLEVSDGFCENFDTLEVTVLPQPFSNAGMDQNICYEEMTSLTGVGDGNISWQDNGNLDDYTIATPNVLNTQATDTFILQIESLVNVGCFGYDSIIVNVNPEIIPTIDFTENLCFNTCDGTISYSVVGGTPDYIETWTDDANNVLASLSNLCSGSYTLSITDDASCTLDSTIVLNQLPEYFIDDIVLTNPICFGDTTGVIEVIATTPQDYIIQNTDNQQVNTFVNLAAEDYLIEVLNTSGCSADTTVTLTSNPEIFITSNFTDASICDGENVMFQAQASGGVNDFNYFWIPAIGDFNTNANVVNTVPTDDVSVEVYATDDAGQCFSDTLTMNATFPPALAIDLASDTLIICQGDIVELEATPSGGAGVLSCTWSTLGEPDINDCIATVDPLIDTDYTISVSDNCSVTATAEVTVIVHETPVPDITLTNATGCFPLEVSFMNNTDPTISSVCTWNFGDGSALLEDCSDVTYTYTAAGSFVPTLTVSSDEGCTATTSGGGLVQVNGYPTVDFTWTPDPVTILEPEAQFINLTEGGTNYQWDAEGAFTSNAVNPYFEFLPNSLDSYNICLAAENEFGCADTLCQFLIIEGRVIVNVPNAFTPDGDGLNEAFLPVAVGISDENYSFQIWSRTGELVFETREKNVPWDGSYAQGDYYVPNDVYTWVLEVQDIMSSDVEVFKGHVTILR